MAVEQQPSPAPGLFRRGKAKDQQPGKCIADRMYLSRVASSGVDSWKRMQCRRTRRICVSAEDAQCGA